MASSKYYVIIIEDGDEERNENPLLFENIQDSIKIDLDAGLKIKNIYAISKLEIKENETDLTFEMKKGE